MSKFSKYQSTIEAIQFNGHNFLALQAFLDEDEDYEIKEWGGKVELAYAPDLEVINEWCNPSDYLVKDGMGFIHVWPESVFNDSTIEIIAR